MNKYLDNSTPALVAADLQHVQLLRGESTQTLNWLLENSEQRQVPAGDVLLSPQQHNDTLYLVLSGRVQVRLDWQGHEALAYLDAGHCVGEMSIIDRERPSAIVVTDTACQLLLIKADTLWTLIDRGTAIARNLLYTLSARVRKDNLVIFESKQQQKISEQNAIHDALTGLNNRRWLEQSLPRMLQRTRQDKQALCLLAIDIDFFKRFNDEHGHAAGDSVLITLSRILEINIRPSDTAVRLGGEEFLILLPDTFVTDARIIAERLCESVRRQANNHQGEPLPALTISIGLACSSEASDATRLIEAADNALYRAKHAGRDQVAI
jgi:diguanylate cyclase (GGDEF)-like protein